MKNIVPCGTQWSQMGTTLNGWTCADRLMDPAKLKPFGESVWTSVLRKNKGIDFCQWANWGKFATTTNSN